MKCTNIILYLLFFSLGVAAQVQDLKPFQQIPPSFRPAIDGSDRWSDEGFEAFIESFDYSGPEIKVDWEFLGPNDIPEQKLHAKSIPTYAENRGNGSGRINFLYLDPYSEGRVFACSPSGGMFVSDDEGLNWRVAGTDALPISGVATVTTDPRDPDLWWITTGDGDDNFMFSDGVWRTEDAGQNWKRINGQIDTLSIPISAKNWKYTRSCEIMALKKCGRPLLYTSNKGLYRCKNGKKDADYIKWEKKLDGFLYDLEQLPWKKKHIVAGGNHIYLSKNNGKTWKQLPDPEIRDKDHEFIRYSIELSPDDEEHIYCVATSRKAWKGRDIGTATLQKYNLKTGVWTEVRDLQKRMNNVIPSRARAFAIAPDNAKEILVGNVQPVYRSIDGGVNFEKIERGQMHDDIHHLVFEEDGETVWAAHDGGVSISRDRGVTWTNRSNGIGAANVHGVDIAQQEETKILFGAYDTGGNLLLDGNWYHVCFGDGFENLIHDEDPNKMITTRQNGSLVKSTSDGIFDQRLIIRGSKVAWYSWMRSDPFESNRVFLAGTKLMRSNDFGDTWESILDVEALDMDWSYKLYPSAFQEGILYTYMLPPEGKDHRFAMSLNADEKKPEDVKWTLLPQFPVNNWVNGFAAAPEEGSFFFSFSVHWQKEKVWYYNGKKYEDVTYNLGYAIPESMIFDKETKRLYIGTSHGVFFLDDGRNKWIRLDGLPGTFIKGMEINYTTDKIVVGTFGRGVWQTDLYRP